MIELVYNKALVDYDNFRNYGQFQNNFDPFGNDQLVFNVDQANQGKFFYIKLDIRTLVYNEEKILDSNSTSFDELQTSQTQEKRDVNQILNAYNTLLEENRILNQTVNDLVEKYENNDDKQVINEQQKTIINLRIQLGQGTVASDFSDDFPYLPLV